jgi:hypothetical protein
MGFPPPHWTLFQINLTSQSYHDCSLTVPEQASRIMIAVSQFQSKTVISCLQFDSSRVLSRKLVVIHIFLISIGSQVTKLFLVLDMVFDFTISSCRLME